MTIELVPIIVLEQGVLLHCTVVHDRLLGLVTIFTEFWLELTGPYMRSVTCCLYLRFQHSLSARATLSLMSSSSSIIYSRLFTRSLAVYSPLFKRSLAVWR
jgi:hypothetical protein